MKTVSKIIRLLRSDIAALSNCPIRLKVSGYMLLVIEAIGLGPRGMPMISVCHYYEQEGDLMKDPDLMLEVSPEGTFQPVAFQQDNMGIYHEAVFNDEGKVKIRPKLVSQLVRFMQMWDTNLRDQGFLIAAKAAEAEGVIADFVVP